MTKTKVTFEHEGQKIIIDFEIQGDNLNYKMDAEPALDEKTQLGLTGFLVETFMKSFHAQVTPEDKSPENGTEN